MRETSCKHRVLKQCAECGICFIVHPVNRTRDDIRCPFGCREHHKKTESARRSLEYYQTKEGRKDKKSRNQNRYLHSYQPKIITPLERKKSSEAFISYIRWVLSLTEGRHVSRQAVKKLLKELETAPLDQIKLSG